MAKSITHTISMLREYIRQTNDDSKYTDSFLYDVLLSVRNDYLPKSLKDGKPIASDLWKIICIQMCQSNFIPCNCIKGKYTVLKSKEKIPNYLTTREHRYIQLFTVDSSIQIPYKTSIQGKNNIYKKGDNKVWFTILDGYLYVVNHPTNTLKALMLKIVLENPLDAIYLSYCDENGDANGDTCYNPHSDTFNITLELENAVLMGALKQLGVSLQLPEDTSNNTDNTVNKY